VNWSYNEKDRDVDGRKCAGWGGFEATWDDSHLKLSSEIPRIAGSKQSILEKKKRES
jgi:hypothetical protein